MARVLIVDDDQGTRDTFSTLLRACHHDVVVAATGSEGRDAIAKCHFDLAIVDLRLGDVSGIELMRTVRMEGKQLPFIMVTGFGTMSDAVEALRLGAKDFIEKPIWADELERVVSAVLSAGVSVVHQTPDNEQHALHRWACSVVPIVNAPRDPKTIRMWGRSVAASSGTLRNWCRTAGISARRSLVFARLLRAAWCLQNGERRLEDLLDVVDLRTLRGLLRSAGFETSEEFPRNVWQYLDRQGLIADSNAKHELAAALELYFAAVGDQERTPRTRWTPGANLAQANSKNT